MQEDLKAAGEILKKGGIILYPTDTVWGLGCDASNEIAVQKLISLKKRAAGKPMIVLLDDLNRLQDFVVTVPEIAWDIVEFAEKPLTVIYPQGKNMAQSIMSEDGSIGIRVTKDEFCRKLIRYIGKPLASTSANISGENTPWIFSEIVEEVKTAVDYVVKYRQNEKTNAQASTIIKLGIDGEIKFLRR